MTLFPLLPISLLGHSEFPVIVDGCPDLSRHSKSDYLDSSTADSDINGLYLSSDAQQVVAEGLHEPYTRTANVGLIPYFVVETISNQYLFIRVRKY